MSATPSILSAPYAPYTWLQDSYALLTRFAQSGQLGVTPVPAASVSFFFITLGTITLARSQALRFVKGSIGNCFATAAVTTFLSCQSSLLALVDNQGRLLRGWPGLYTGNTLGANGQSTTITDDEVLLGADYVATGGDGSNFNMQYSVDVRNTDAAAHSINITATLLFEIWELSPKSRLRG